MSLLSKAWYALFPPVSPADFASQPATLELALCSPGSSMLAVCMSVGPRLGVPSGMGEHRCSPYEMATVASVFHDILRGSQTWRRGLRVVKSSSPSSVSSGLGILPLGHPLVRIRTRLACLALTLARLAMLVSAVRAMVVVVMCSVPPFWLRAAQVGLAVGLI